MDLTGLWVFFGVVEVGETAMSALKSGDDVSHELLWVKGEFCSPSCVSMDRIFHLVQLVPVEVVPVHRQYKCFNGVPFRQNPLNLLAEVALARGTSPSHPNEGNATILMWHRWMRIDYVNNFWGDLFYDLFTTWILSIFLTRYLANLFLTTARRSLIILLIARACTRCFVDILEGGVLL